MSCAIGRGWTGVRSAVVCSYRKMHLDDTTWFDRGLSSKGGAENNKQTVMLSVAGNTTEMADSERWLMARSVFEYRHHLDYGNDISLNNTRCLSIVYQHSPSSLFSISIANCFLSFSSL